MKLNSSGVFCAVSANYFWPAQTVKNWLLMVLRFVSQIFRLAF